MHDDGARRLVLAITMTITAVVGGCNDEARDGTGRASGGTATAPGSGTTGSVPRDKGKSPIQSDADCRKAPVCKDFGACTHKGGKCTVTSDGDCVASSFCKMTGKCVAHDGQCRIGAAKDQDCNTPHGVSGLNPCESKGHCTAKDRVCVATKDEDCGKTRGCRETGQCTAKDGRCVVGSEKDCRRSMACAQLKACEFLPGKDGRGGLCAPPEGSDGHEGHNH